MTPNLPHLRDEDESRPESPSGRRADALSAGLEAEPSGVLTVETAAIRIGDAVFTLPRPNRHHNVIWWLHVLGVPSGLMHDQGFVLSNGCYVDRESAAHFANLAGQFERLISPPNLFSEDLWDGGADLPSVDAIKALSTSTASPHQAPTGRVTNQ